MTTQPNPNQHSANFPHDAQVEIRNTLDALVMTGDHAIVLGDTQVQTNTELGTRVTRFDLMDGTQVDRIKALDETIRLKITPQLPLTDSLSGPVTLRERPDGSVEMDGSPDDEFQVVLGVLGRLADETLALQQERIDKGGSLIKAPADTPIASNQPGTASRQSSRRVTPLPGSNGAPERYSSRRVRFDT